ncbi:MAG: GAF domain-containing SpoIIE family protein phosphatase [Jaaginema sp. PMC 1079.18]|nr:GAF domain-containing SpoIIE family protein phosphatase [Jaaginema sp. PMC 1080.18]MEC4851509.1 GAF domain-containing SpoIIE family protein phosphatase [Jaaginema sp. PMC 1079.18]MEC4868011.1 GAF domain-containing SpoIIE family protein phosphatase [Jaaginema sp. PMC 1078.18]
MGDRNQSLQYDDEELRSLRQDVAAQALPRKLLETLVAMARSSKSHEMLDATLQQTLNVSTEITQAEEGSIFLLDHYGRVTNCILSPTEPPLKANSDQLDRALESGLVSWVKRTQQVGLIADTERDERWIVPQQQEYTARSVLAIPILKEDELLGIVSLLHSQPHHFSQHTAELMQLAADQISLVLQNARLYAELDRRRAMLNQELEKGQYIQRNFLPESLPQLPDWEIASYFKPARMVAGDFYDVFDLPDNQLGLVIADVCDKGVGAALFMALFRSLIRIFSGQTQLEGVSFHSEFTSVLLDKLSSVPIPLEAITYAQPTQKQPNHSQINALKAVRLTNNYIALNHGDLGMFATLFFGILDPKTSLLTYINAGHDPLFILDTRGGVKEVLSSTGPALGLLPNLQFRIHQTYLDVGDLLFGYTDGVTEARSQSGALFTEKRLLQLLDTEVISAQAVLDRVVEQVLAHTGTANQFDDITMLAVRRKFVAVT